MKPTDPAPTADPAAHTRTLYVIMNGGSGADTGDISGEIETTLRTAGHTVTIHKIEPGTSFKDSCSELIAQAKMKDGTLVAAGGDGTVNAVAALCYEHDLPLGVIPLGTFNYFARAIGIPTNREEALDALGSDHTRTVSAGFVHEHLFLNNVSFGLYPKLIRKREQATARFGRKRIVAALSALHSLFHEQQLFAVKVNAAEENAVRRTSMVFVGNNTLQLENLGLEVSECTQQDQLAVVILKPLDRWHTCRLIWRSIIRNMKFDEKLIQFCTSEFEVDTHRASMELAIDGELIRCNTPLAFRVDPKAITVIAPPPEAP